MKKYPVARFGAITAGLMLSAVSMLNSGLVTRRARAFTVHTVTTTADSVPGSLRDAVGSSADGDTIMFNLALPATISLFAGEINIASSITITGPGFSQLTISSLNRVFSVGPTATVSISGLTVANGADNQDLAGGAGILNSHQLSVTNCLFSGNKALGGGGAIRNNGTSLIVTNCTFNSNFTTSFGGGIFNSAGTGSLVVANSTFNGNTAGLGGGVANSQGSLLVASNCTFANNKATSSGGAIQGDISSAISLANCTISGSSGGGIFMLGLTLDVQNCIIADSTGNPDCTSVMPLALNSHNLIK